VWNPHPVGRIGALRSAPTHAVQADAVAPGRPVSPRVGRHAANEAVPEAPRVLPAPPPGRGSFAWWRWWSLIGIVAIIGYFLVPRDGLSNNMYYNAVAMTSAVLIVVGTRINRPPHAALWYLFALGQGMWALGDIVYALQVEVLHGTSFPSAADAIYLCAYPLLAAGVFLLIRGRRAGRDRAGLLDALIIATGLGLLSWTFVMRPTVVDASLTSLEQLVSLAYPSGDILLIAMAVRLSTTPGARMASYRLLMAALLLLFGSDVTYAAISTLSSYNGGAVDAGWLLSYVAWAAAALHPSMRSLSDGPHDRTVPVTRRRLIPLAAAALVAPVILIFQGVQGQATVDWLAAGVGSIVIFSLVLARVSGLVAQIQDQAAQLEALAHNDVVTGLPNRRCWDLELARRLADSCRTGEQVVVALLDLDHFKHFNDRYGHQAGDRLLKEASAAWRSQLHPDHLLARYGGEEFGFCITGMSAASVCVMLDRMQAVTPLGQAFSAGVARWTGGESPTCLVDRADQALYRAKNEGRRRVVVYNGDTTPWLGKRFELPRHHAGYRD
jgi:diguanylate cyclase (GGDEF)-like protein